MMIVSFFFNDTATTEIYTLSLHDALPILARSKWVTPRSNARRRIARWTSSDRSSPKFCHSPRDRAGSLSPVRPQKRRSEEHTSELQSRQYLVCRLLLEKKQMTHTHSYVPQ